MRRVSISACLLAALGCLPLVARPSPGASPIEPRTGPGEARPRAGGSRPLASTSVPYPARVSENHRFLLDQAGKPFFYLADTAWELFHRLSREEADVYLKNRAANRFNVIQAVVLAEHGFDVPTPGGHIPLQNQDPTRPLEPYFQDVDWVVRRAEELGMCVGMLPTWGDKWNKKWGQGPEIFTPENARTYGEFLGKRYRDRPIVWILGGDRPIESERHKAIIRAMAEGLRAGDGGRHLITYHPMGGAGSADWLHDEPWLDFNMCQTGHGFNHENFRRIAADYARTPVKPCLDAEPGYEDHPAEFNAKNGYLDAYEARKFAYWAVFAGACGHTYGCHDIWQFFAPGRKPITAARTPWREAMLLPGAGQMQHLRALIESRPMLARIPAQDMILGDPGKGTDRIAATRAEDGSYAFVYASSGMSFSLNLEPLSGEKIRTWWLDPRSGDVREGEVFVRRGRGDSSPTQGKVGLGADPRRRFA
ncbi:MAG: glycoside hydrolase family 140 protein [Isosphaeraceae bacterium]